ncbi:MAG: hypothetical protein C0504_09280 [Candidatus Solibacter sp.]|nr:hypothetical protein [Candidatus Solibacter sp.]
MTANPVYICLVPFAAIFFQTAPARAQGPAEAVVVVNDASALSRTAGEYYSRARGIPASQICRVRTAEVEEIDRSTYESEIEAPIAKWLIKSGLTDKTLILATTAGLPLKIRGSRGAGSTAASVDSELAALYMKLKGVKTAIEGPHPNPFYASRRKVFAHPDVPIYMVARLAGYRFEDIRAMIDRALRAENRGVVVLDMKDGGRDGGDEWLRRAARKLPPERVVLEETGRVAAGIGDVIGYAGWGSNDPNRKTRTVSMAWLPGAVVTEYVSTNARTFAEPPAEWNIGRWGLPAGFWKGSPQSLTADWIRAGATAATGHVYEPYLAQAPRPEELFMAYVAEGRTLAESFYRAIPSVSWMNVLAGDPLCRLKPVTSPGRR